MAGLPVIEEIVEKVDVNGEFSPRGDHLLKTLSLGLAQHPPVVLVFIRLNPENHLPADQQRDIAVTNLLLLAKTVVLKENVGNVQWVFSEGGSLPRTGFTRVGQFSFEAPGLLTIYSATKRDLNIAVDIISEILSLQTVIDERLLDQLVKGF